MKKIRTESTNDDSIINLIEVKCLEDKEYKETTADQKATREQIA